MRSTTRSLCELVTRRAARGTGAAAIVLVPGRVTAGEVEAGYRAIVSCLASPPFAADVRAALSTSLAKALRSAPSTFVSCVRTQLGAALSGARLRRALAVPNSTFAAMSQAVLRNPARSNARINTALRPRIETTSRQVGERCIHIVE